MSIFIEKDSSVFDIFYDRWGLVTAGDIEDFNSCTIGWGSFGTLWSKPGRNRKTITVYLYPARYTCDVLQDKEYFTVSFFPESYKKALGYMGSHSGRDGNKAEAAGLTPCAFGEGVTYEEANLSFLCRKLYQHQLTKEDLAEEIQKQYADNPAGYPVDENGDWNPHWIFIGEVIKEEDKR